MKYTSAEASKLLRKLNEDYHSLLEMERQSKTFIAALEEDIESVRPEYDYANVQAQLEDIASKIRKVKHAINVFNTTHIIPELGMTIDMVLVLIPQLSEKKMKLYSMKSQLPKVRETSSSRSNIIDYLYANYDIKAVEADYAKVSELLVKAQTSLDYINNTETMEIDL